VKGTENIRPFRKNLFSYAELIDYSTVTVDVLLLEISEKASSLTNHFEKTSAAVVVVVVELEMLVEMVDSCRENGNLNLGRACVAFVHSVFCDNLLFLFLKHCVSPHKNIFAFGHRSGRRVKRF